MRGSQGPAATAAATMLVLSAAGGAHAQSAVALTPGFQPDPQRVTGTSGGTVQAQSVDSRCRGWISPQPNHVVTVPQGLAFLRVFVESEADTTLVMRAPNGQFFCDDDSFGVNPKLDAAYGPGTYLLWVGSYSSGTTAPYAAVFSEQRNLRPREAGSTPSVTTGEAAGRTLTVASPAVGTAIQDNQTVSATAVVTQNCIIARLAVTVRGRHSFARDLVLRLRGPGGQSETLQSHNNRNPFRRYSTTHFAGASAAGPWVLSVADQVAQDGGVLNGFTLSLTCR